MPLSYLSCRTENNLNDNGRSQTPQSIVEASAEKEGIAWRRIPEPDREVMAKSADRVMVPLREEGRKEAKVVSVTAARVLVEGENAEGEMYLTKGNIYFSHIS